MVFTAATLPRLPTPTEDPEILSMKMCQRLIETIEYECRHRIDSVGSVLEYQGCTKCGIIKKTVYMGKMVKRAP
ncbi:hypothetical protein H112_01997 [Trichophyton rubrum D6]|uniref:Uncharacterized protein n=2 Tax=Trichophyton TaxID=5550 RepID=A0A022WAB8_TRIRU|nr:hypothetical protein H100_01993 [Trichophyton rubrum MR850]EZF44765.1 hypothetical protein H102_01991 [Trichophyton rubrum CBS 100081]EZF55365.1 hypothetical protein H103_02002 [Trichophyton rubrum CBS 288.86]EZF65982.1 hypothetical protein H104_01977 [Trichophyton rubrum CBS 289.86]EZF76651.1 hypothetical protein H105_02007 [Trichophyton soudanense CBS 452.61]EZF87284.1 hypothetical protein H110_02001 [Trichophyton rubrum MR1448]EZF98004.1 hypothetical protein H113_02000 [Trichophyton rub